jgi:nucleoside phosphorylase/tetratricopeptide (TPR) repeat protein
MPNDPIDFLIITALEHEAQAVIRRLADHHIERFEDRNIRTYHCGTVPIDNSDRAYRVVVVLLPSMGELSAANATTDALPDWQPQHVLMIGIAGGLVQDDLERGDVVVADQVVGYDYGKQYDNALKPRDHVYPSSALLLERVRNFALLGDEWAQHIEVSRPAGARRDRAKRFVGPLASGNKVIASQKFQVRLLKRWPKLIAIETEAEGVFAAVFDRPAIKHVLVIRGISDMADKDKNDAWQMYAADAAAAYAIAFLKSGPVETETPILDQERILDAAIAKCVPVGKPGDVVGRDKIVDSSIKTGDIVGVTAVAIGHGASASVTNIYEAPPPVITALHQLPSPYRDFTGREAELAELMTKAETDGTTIFGLQGLGGVGKTALALVFAERLKQRYPDAQFYLDLKGADKQPLSTNAVFAHVIHAYQPLAKLPTSGAELRGLYLSMLDGQRALLLMDNVADKTQVESLVPPSSCFLLITSRQHFAMPGLFAKDLNTLPLDDACDLLLKISPRIGGQAGVLAKLCGYLPLALRLAGSALAERRTLTLEGYVQRLANTQTRLELVEASLSLSYDLLSEELQRAWRVLAVFRDTFDLAATAAVWSIEGNLAQDRLDELIRYSLVEWNEIDGHAHLHDLVRLFAEKHLKEDERRVAHQRAGRYYDRAESPRFLFEALFHFQRSGEHDKAAELAMRNTAALIGVGRMEDLRLLLEGFNIEQLGPESTAAINISLGQVYTLLEEASAQSKFEQAISQAVALPPSPAKHELLARAHRGMGELFEHQSPGDALDYFQRGLHELGGSTASLEADIYIKMSGIQIDQGDYLAAQESIEQGLRLLPASPSQLRAAALLNQSDVYYKLGDAEKGQQIALQSLKISEQLHDDWMILKLKINMAFRTEIAGDWSQAVTIYQEALELAQRLGDVRHLIVLRINLGLLHTNMGDYAAAKGYLQQGLESARQHDLKGHLVNVLCNLADLDLRQGQWQTALPALREAEPLAKEIGYDPILPEIYRSLAQAYLLQQEPRKALTHANRSVKLAKESGDEIEIGKSLRALGQVQWANNQPERALISFERSVLLLANNDPYEAARTKLEWGRALLDTDRDRATSLLCEAHATFEKLGAWRDQQAVEHVLKTE